MTVVVESEDAVDPDETSPIISKPSLESHPPTKRRRLNTVISETDIESKPAGKVGDSEFSDTFSVDEDGPEDKENEDAEQAKSKSKYKIHIPRNPQFPTDAFFTQPPQRSSSPYRIEKFHWKKPRQVSPPPLPLLNIQGSSSWLTPKTLDVSTAPGVKLSKKQASHVSTTLIGRCEPEDDFGVDESYENLLADLPSDAFSSPNGSPNCASKMPILVSSQQASASQWKSPQRLVAPLANLRQTTLFGTQAQETPLQTQSTRKHNWPLANRQEPPTHHTLNQEALKTWLYPTNLGTIRDYQYSVVAQGLYHNLLVALPTGLGKTFIAATIMLNWFRWTTDAQIVFVAPTKPLVSQQVKACFGIAGIPRSETTMLTGGISPGLRAEEWRSKRVFFMTPQTIVNDLKTGICDPKRLVLLVVDEAHRATGSYAYVEVVKFLKRFNASFRVLALTATPGASIESVQEVIDGLGISRIEIRTEESLDIRQYVHARKIETILFDNSEEMAMVMGLFSRALQPVLDKLNGMNAYWAKDPMTLTPFGCDQARKKWMNSDAGRKAAMPAKWMINTIFILLASLSHGIELLKFHGIAPFYRKVLDFRNNIHNDGKKGGKYANQINESEPFQTMMSRIHHWINNGQFVGHPKLEYLQSVIMNHFLDAGEGRGASDPSNTRVMVFSHYRDSAEEIVRVLQRNEPMIRSHVFVGQAHAKGSDGMDQKKQLDTVKKFQTGIYNTLVATSIGEEGLDIGEVDLIICYDASASPIRMLQRMGRTGRKRAGNIVVTLMRGKEENNFIKAKDNYEKMQQEIAAGTRFTFHDDESRRIVPKHVQPLVDKRIVDIPLENTQADLPEPTRRGRPPKRPPKKFHMPDGVRTGFMKASRLGEDEENLDDLIGRQQPKKRLAKSLSPERLPTLEEVLLTSDEESEFERRYLDIKGDASQIVEIPRNDVFPDLQRSHRPVHHLKHGHAVERTIQVLNKMHNMPHNADEYYKRHLHSQDQCEGLAQAEKRSDFFKASWQLPSSSQLSPASQTRTNQASFVQNERPKDPRKIDNTPIHMSSAEYGTEGNISDLINDEEEEERNVSSDSSSPPTVNVDEHVAQRQSRTADGPIDIDLVSEEDLPDFGTLVQKTGTREVLTVTQRTRATKASEGGRRGRRRVIEDDTDDE